MRVIILLLFVGLFAATPVYLLDHYVMPELIGMKQTYGSFDELSAKVIDPLPGQ